jgi:hypothetical protein
VWKSQFNTKALNISSYALCLIEMSEDTKNIRAMRIQTFIDDLRNLKNNAYSTAKEGYLPTLLWSLATDITVIDSVRWRREGISETMLYKHYRYIAPDSIALIATCREFHERMNILFPNLPERYTVRYIVMKYIINMNENPNTVFEDLMKLKYEVD